MTFRKPSEIKGWVKARVGPYRFTHIEGVVKTASRLALRYRLSTEKAELAAWLHDCGKELSRSEMRYWLNKGKARLDPLEKRMPGLWHPHVGAVLAALQWGVRDASVLEAIRCHTLGSPQMRPLAQLVFVADFIEPTRDFKGVMEARKAARSSLIEGVLAKASMTIGSLLEKKMKIHPRLLETWNAFLDHEQKTKEKAFEPPRARSSPRIAKSENK